MGSWSRRFRPLGSRVMEFFLLGLTACQLEHFLSHSNHSHTDMPLIPLEKIHSSRDSSDENRSTREKATRGAFSCVG